MWQHLKISGLTLAEFAVNTLVHVYRNKQNVVNIAFIQVCVQSSVKANISVEFPMNYSCLSLKFI